MMCGQCHVQPHTLALTFLAGFVLMVAGCRVPAPSLEIDGIAHPPDDVAVNVGMSLTTPIIRLADQKAL